MRAFVLLTVLLALAGAVAAAPGASPKPSPKPTGSSPAPAGATATKNETADLPPTTEPATGANATADLPPAAGMEPMGADNATAAEPAAGAGAMEPMGGANATAAEPAAAGAVPPAAPVEPVCPKPGKLVEKNPAISCYFSDGPAAAIEHMPELSSLKKLAGDSKVFKEFKKDKTYDGTIFAPNNAGVAAAQKWLKELGQTDLKPEDVDTLLQYHITAGKSPILLADLTKHKSFTMLNNTGKIFVNPGAAPAAGGARRMLLQAAAAGAESVFIGSDSGQKFAVQQSNIQSGKAMVHIIDGVLVPMALLESYGFNDTASLPAPPPGFSNATAEAEATSANGTDATAGGAAGGAAGAAGTTSRDAAGAGAAPADSTTKKSSAATAAATLLAVPALLAALML